MNDRNCDSCIHKTAEGCRSWECEYINRDDAIEAWREKQERQDDGK